MIKIKNMSKTFDDRVLFKNLNLDIPLNQLTFIVGQSGCGKSTLLNMIGGIEPRLFKSTISIELKDKIIDLRTPYYWYLTDFVFQDFNLIEDLSGLENIMLGNSLKNQSFYKKDAIKLLEEFQIDKSIYLEKVKNLSIGEKQRIAILRCVSRNSKILLIDEPTGNLDEKNSKIVFELLQKMSKTKTVIVASYDTEYALKYSDNVIEIKNQNASYIKKSFDNPESIEKKETLREYAKKPKKGIFNIFALKLKLLIILSLSDLRKKWLSFLLILVSIFLIVFTGVTILQIGTERININSNFLTLQSRRINLSASPFNKEIRNINSIKGVKSVLKNYDFSLKIKNYKSDDYNSISNWNTILVKNNDFFKNQIISSRGFEGEFFKKPNDIIISKELQDKLKITNPIGKTIVVSFEKPYNEILSGVQRAIIYSKPLFGKDQELRIVGVNKEKDFDTEPFNYLNIEFIKNLYLDKDDSIPKNSQFFWINKDFLPEITKNFDLSTLTGNEKITKKFNVENFKYNPRSIYLSSQFVKTHPMFLEPDFITKKDLFLSYKNTEQYVKIAGVFESNKEEIKMSQSDFNLFSKIPWRDSYIYFDNQFAQNEFYNKYKKDISITNPLHNIMANGFNKYKIDYQTTYYFIIPAALLVILTMSAIFVISMLMASNKKRQMAIMKVLGASTGRIFFIYLTLS